MKRFNRAPVWCVWGITVASLGSIALVATGESPTSESSLRLYDKPSQTTLLDAIDNAATSVGVPAVILRAIVERDSAGGEPKNLFSYHSSWFKTIKDAPEYAKYTEDEKRMGIALHGYAHVSGFAAAHNCAAHFSLMYDPTENLVCAARILRGQLDAAKQDGKVNTSPSLATWTALVRYRRVMMPVGRWLDAESQYYADTVLTRVAGLLLDSAAKYDPAIAHQLLPAKRADVLLKTKDKRGKPKRGIVIWDGIGSRFAGLYEKLFGQDAK